jgi:uncharacterized protein YecT (DUF1311 family)
MCLRPRSGLSPASAKANQKDSGALEAMLKDGFLYLEAKKRKINAMSKWSTLLVSMLISVAHVHAQSQASMNAVARSDFARADADLNKTYQSVLAKLPTAESKQKVREKQRAWIVSRDAEAARAAKEAEGGSMASTLRYEKMTELTRKRITELKPMIGEQSAGGPQTDTSQSPGGQTPPSSSPTQSLGEKHNADENTDQPQRCDCDPSPDGRFAFVTSEAEDSFGDTVHRIDLIDKRSGKVSQRIGEEDMPGTYWHVLWASDSSRFALMTRLGHPIQGVSVYSRSGETFRNIDLPRLPEANIPEKLKHGKKFGHVASLNWQEATEWKKDGSLVVEIETMIDGEGGSLSATRTVVIGFDRAGKAKIVKSTIKYETDESDPVVKAEKLETAGETALEKGDVNRAIAAYTQAIKLNPDGFSAYYARGCANFMKRDWANALSDFQRHCDLRKQEQYQVFPARFYIWLIRARLGDKEVADKELAPYMEGHPAEWSGGWDAKTGNFLLGRTSEDDFLASLSDNPGEAWFYAGMKRLLNNDRASAADAFKKCMATAKTAEEHQLAAAELKALSQ